LTSSIKRKKVIVSYVTNIPVHCSMPVHSVWALQVMCTGCSGLNPGSHLYCILELMLYFDLCFPTIFAF